MMNVLSMYALIGAYQPEGYEWVDELRQVLTENVEFACDYIKEHFDEVEVSKPQGTYMLFLDCEKWCKAHGKNMDELDSSRTGSWSHVAGRQTIPREYGIRMNLAPAAVTGEGSL